ncbi:hypothetical protein [Levilactobacillus acidifarinae]|uniref:RelB antitoxin n=1 Tax=Levilactobacillus acidifarinae DSM 19394 = JCM 15949 TaxID=1423715 RepID=A0A0R1LGV2_9LACO|nr:hypothetical protein [Levilactobacillus acidifarinae]KRK95118.1 hypothetical protein FD25_GL001624 [Levilactobacillus acidifarinae DSM 19394]GEO70617.1 hypothetical protein LAC03_25270 [Levilactobacillus acidifarinae]
MANPEIPQETFQFSLDCSLAQDAQTIFDRSNLTPTEAITMFYQCTVMAGQLPFSDSQLSQAKALTDLQRAAKNRPIDDLNDPARRQAWLDNPDYDY